MSGLKIVEAVQVAELADDGKPLLPGGAIGYKGATYQSVLAPEGSLVAVVIYVGGKELARKEYVSAPKTGSNVVVEVRAKVFNNAKIATFKPAPVEEVL
jgi:hypothetical protein